MEISQHQFGCSVRGLNANEASAEDLDQIKDLLYKNRLVILKDQTLSEPQYCDFAHRFGQPVPYLQENYHHPEYPLIFVSSNVKQGGKKMGVPRTGGYWHSDTSFEQDPKFITMLMPKVMPVSVPRTTEFIDMSEVYKALPQDVRAAIAGRDFIHSGRWRYKVRESDQGLDIHEILQMIDFHAPPVRHPAVIEHPYTGEKIVYGNRGFTIGIAGMGQDESASILRRIFDLAETDRFIRKVQWSLGDLIIWDNRFLSHCSGRPRAYTGDNIHEEVKKEEETMMYRITLRDGLPLCATQAEQASAA